MASQKVFSVAPTTSITRSMFRRPSQNKTTMKLGEITPIYLEQDVLPGDTFKIKLSSLVRMSTPMTPILDNIYIDYYAFFVPNRLCWPHWKEFMGENTTSAGIYSGSEYIVPQVNIKNSAISVGSLGDHLGLPIVTGTSDTLVSALPGRAYVLCYNEWFRDQNIIAPIPLDTSDSGRITVGNTFGYGSALLKGAKISDYFTRALPYAQKGGAVSIPLGTSAPVIMEDLTSGASSLTDNNYLLVRGNKGTTTFNPTTFAVQDGQMSGGLVNAKLYADLEEATSATINQLRFAFAYQKMLEKDALFGTRYWEIIKGHFAVTAPDASLQRPQLLGSFRQHINIDQVLSTAGYDPSAANNKLGIPGANSVSGSSNDIVTFSSVEHGMILILALARHDQTYSQGLARGWTRKHRTDYYFPVFANLGAQTVLKKEIMCVGSSTDDENFGYQEAWAEYRYKNSLATSLMRPTVSGGLSDWTLATRFGSVPTLGKTFIEQDRTALSDCLVTGSNGPDFLCDFFFDEVAVRPMPLYSIPGLIDHH